MTANTEGNELVVRIALQEIAPGDTGKQGIVQTECQIDGKTVSVRVNVSAFVKK